MPTAKIEEGGRGLRLGISIGRNREACSDQHVQEKRAFYGVLANSIGFLLHSAGHAFWPFYRGYVDLNPARRNASKAIVAETHHVSLCPHA